MKIQVKVMTSLILLTTLAMMACSGSNGEDATATAGRFVAFHSEATNLVADDTNGLRDIFVHDNQTGETIRVNVASNGDQAAGGDSEYPSLSADGRYTAFQSEATNLVSDDANGLTDIFAHDSQTGQTIRVNVASNGDQAAGGGSGGVSISADGRYVAFRSGATNLVSGDTNGEQDIFVHDCQTGETIRVNVASNGDQANAGGNDRAYISADGRYVAFQSDATNLVSDDTNGLKDIFVHDSQTGVTTRVNLDSSGAQSAGGGSEFPTISGDGRYTAFQSDATNLVTNDTNELRDIFLHDSQTGQTIRVNVASNGDQAAGGGSEKAVISGDGRYVGFHSDATNLVANDTNGLRDIFVHDSQTGQTIRVSVASNGDQASGGINEYPAISDDGRFVAWQSDATNLVTDDTNGDRDIYVHDSQTGDTVRVSVSSAGDQSNGRSYDPSY